MGGRATLAALPFLLAGLPASASPPPPTDGATGRLDRSVIMKAMKVRLPAMQRCAEEALMRQGEVTPAKLMLRFVIGLDGRVSDAEVEGPTPPDPRYAACVLKAVRALKTPPPEGGVVVVRYPFLVCSAGL